MCIHLRDKLAITSLCLSPYAAGFISLAIKLLHSARANKNKETHTKFIDIKQVYVRRNSVTFCVGQDITSET